MTRALITSLVTGAYVFAVLLLPLRLLADSTSVSVDSVLQQEARWLKAIVAGDRKTVDAILAPNFKHITAEGKRVSRAEEMASTVKLPIVMNPSEQTVDLAGNVAVVHGLNTVTESGKGQARELFTDVFVNQNGSWKAISAQETAVR